jgi:hypothetical protein
MNEQQYGFDNGRTAERPLRPVLIASEKVLDEYSPFIEHLLVGLADESVLSAFVCPADFDIGGFVSPAVETIRYPALNLPFFNFGYRSRLIEQLENFKPTVLHCLGESDAALTVRLAKILKLPSIITINSMQRRFSSFTFLLKKFSAIITPADSIASAISSSFAKLADRLVRINTGTFIEQRCSCFSNKSQVISMVISHCIGDTTDLMNFFAAVKHLVVDGYQFMLVIAGAGKAESRLRKVLCSQGLSRVAIVVGPLKPRRRVLAAGDIFIRARPSENFDPFLFEAMSVGTAVAACRGGVDDLIIEGRTAAVFNPDDELSIYNCLKQLLDRPERAKQLAKNAHQNLKENYTVSGMLTAVLRTYRTVQQEFDK